LTRRDSCFPVFSPKAAANWQTDADPLISNALLFSNTIREKKRSGKQKSGSSADGLGGPNNLNRPAPRMAIQRRYQPAATVLDDLVEVLYRLLADGGGDEHPVTSSVPARGCDRASEEEAR
jgi:hypothetical protein